MRLSTLTRRLPELWSSQMKWLLAVLVVIGGSWLFIELADEVLDNDTHAFDHWVVESLRRADDPSVPIGPTWVLQIARDITALGGLTVIAMIAAAVAGYLLLIRQYAAMWLLLAATAGGAGLSFLLKAIHSRPRPELVPHLTEVATTSFPSGHSFMAAAFYLTLGAMLAGVVPGRRLKLYFLSLALVVTLLVGLTRVYLGVHYPTDILAGWTAGLVWAVLCMMVWGGLKQRGLIRERTSPEDENADADRQTS